MLIFWVFKGGGGLKEQKMVQNEKNSFCRTPYPRGTIHHITVIFCLFGTHCTKNKVFHQGKLHFLCSDTCVKWWYLLVFLSIFQNFDFPGCQGVKGQKMAQNDNILSVVPYISGTIYHMIFISGAHL